MVEIPVQTTWAEDGSGSIEPTLKYLLVFDKIYKSMKKFDFITVEITLSKIKCDKKIN